MLTPGAELGALAKYFHGMTPIDSTSGDWNSRLLPMADHASSEEFKMRPLHAIAITVLVSTLAMADVRTHEPVSEVFKALDRNNDQRISRQEAEADRSLRDRFVAVDSDADHRVPTNLGSERSIP